MSKHTPGPWEIDPETGELKGNGYILGMIYGAQDFPCLDDESDEYREHLRECVANGQLVKTAPRLLDACEALLQIIDSGDYYNDEICNQARAVIAEVRGDT